MMENATQSQFFCKCKPGEEIIILVHQMNNFMNKIYEFSDHCNRQTEEAGLCCREEEILGDRLIISSGLLFV